MPRARRGSPSGRPGTARLIAESAPSLATTGAPAFPKDTRGADTASTPFALALANGRHPTISHGMVLRLSGHRSGCEGSTAVVGSEAQVRPMESEEHTVVLALALETALVAVRRGQVWGVHVGRSRTCLSDAGST